MPKKNLVLPQPAAEALREPPAPLIEATALNKEADKAVAAFFHEGTSRHTARTYQTALRYWGAWHALRYGQSIDGPVRPEAVLQFIVDHLEHLPHLAPPEVTPFTGRSESTQHLLPIAIDRVLVERQYKKKLGPWSLATVETRIAALSKAHEQYMAENAHLKLGAETNPVRDPRVRQLWAAVRRAYARRAHSPTRPVAATRSVMEALLATCGKDLIGIRDRAVLLFGFASGGRRRSEITAATFENVRRDGGWVCVRA